LTAHLAERGVRLILSDIIVETVILFPPYSQVATLLAEVFQGYSGKKFVEPFPGGPPHRLGHAAPVKFAPALVFLLSGGALHQKGIALGSLENFPHGYLFRLPGKTVSTLGAPFAFQDTRFLEALKDLLQIPGGDILSAGNILDLTWEGSTIVGHVEKGAQSITALGGKSHDDNSLLEKTSAYAGKQHIFL
jgi:hypothetical protein